MLKHNPALFLRCAKNPLAKQGDFRLLVRLTGLEPALLTEMEPNGSVTTVEIYQPNIILSALQVFGFTYFNYITYYHFCQAEKTNICNFSQ